MRSLLFGLVVTTVAALWPTSVMADRASEGAIARRIAGNLKNSGQMERYHIGVKFSEGTAWLLGSVANRHQEEMAMEIAENTSGVHHVVSKLAVNSGSGNGNLRQPHSVVRAKSTLGLQSKGRRSHRAEEEIWPSPQGDRQNTPLPYASLAGAMQGVSGPPRPAHAPAASGVAPARYDQPHMPGYAWPSYAAYPNYAGLTYPRQYSPTAWPFIGPFYPYPQVPLGWRKVSLEWDDGWWQLDFKQ